MKRISGRDGIADYVDTLDGFRALGVLLVMVFHFWQQSWFTFSFTVFGYSVDFTNIVVIGAFGVEVLFILSGFCLYYPLAMHPGRRLHMGAYVYKRAVRILPSYLLCVLVCSAYQIGRLDAATLRSQFIGNMTLTQMMTPALAYNRINGVLWSIAIEAQFYVLFPLLAKAVRRRPYLTMLAAFLVGEGFRWYLRDIDYSQINFLMNQMPAMIDVFVGGMLAAHVAAQLQRTLEDGQKRSLAPAFALAALMFLLLWIAAAVYMGRLRYDNMPENLSRLRMQTRKYLVAGFAGAIGCSVLSADWIHKALGNRVARFFSVISYQLYLWHIWIALRLKDFRIPEYATERPMDDAAWRAPYLLLSVGLSLAVATALTYGFERPLSRYLLKRAPRWARPDPKAGEEAGNADA